jgi:hypothetical protein
MLHQFKLKTLTCNQVRIQKIFWGFFVHFHTYIIHKPLLFYKNMFNNFPGFRKGFETPKTPNCALACM